MGAEASASLAKVAAGIGNVEAGDGPWVRFVGNFHHEHHLSSLARAFVSGLLVHDCDEILPIHSLIVGKLFELHIEDRQDRVGAHVVR